MTTPISICSAALMGLGATAIASLSENSDRARLCANLYPVMRAEVLRKHTWKSAVKRVQLAPLTPGPAFGYTQTFLLPGDWGRTMSVGGEGGYAVDFRQEGRNLLTNSSVVFLRYVANGGDEGGWDDLLISVMVKRMKWELAYPITKSTSLAQACQQDFMMALAEAKSIDSMGAPTDKVAPDSPLIDCRF